MDSERLEKEKEKVRKYNAQLFQNINNYKKWIESGGKEYEQLLAEDEVMATISLPMIDEILPIYHGTSEEVLAKGVGHLDNTSLPMGGPSSHTVLTAHRGLPGAKLFSDLNLIKEGDVFYLTVLEEKLAYEVYRIEIVEPEDADSLVIEPGKDLVTLITCTPYGVNTHRLLVHGKRIPYTQTDKTGFSDGVMETPLKWQIHNAILFLIILVSSRRIYRVQKRRKGKQEKN